MKLKYLVGFFIILSVYSCEKSLLGGGKIFGLWELTSYRVDGVEKIDKYTFSRDVLNVVAIDYNKNPGTNPGKCRPDSVYSIRVYHTDGDKTIEFEKTGFCTHTDDIDPLYYYNDTILENKWKIKKINNKILHYKNSLTDRNQKIEVIFEKIKNHDYVLNI